MPIYELPDLTYDYSALEPHISGQIMELHHSRHHGAYVAGANATLERLEEVRSKSDFGAITMLEKNLAFHTSGHVLHSLFWSNLSPDGGDKPSGDLATAIDRDFGSFDALAAHLSNATNSVQGSGWGALAYEPIAGKLIVQQIYDHQGNIVTGSVPLLVIDAWEHALLPPVQERPRRLRESGLERDQLAGRGAALAGGPGMTTNQGERSGAMTRITASQSGAGWSETRKVLLRSMLESEAKLVLRLSQQMREIADEERAAGIDSLHTVNRLVRLAEQYASELTK